MSAFYVTDVVLATPPAQPGYLYGCYDGTYIWAVTGEVGGRKLVRVRASDGVIVGTDGLDTDYLGANAFFTITAAAGQAPKGIVYCPGTNEIAIPCGENVEFFNATTFAHTATVYIGSGHYSESVCTDGTTHYLITDWNGLGSQRLRSINPTSRVITNVGPLTGSGWASYETVQCLKVNGFIWISDGNRSNSVYKVDPATGAVVQAVVVSSVNSSGTCIATDGTYLFSGTNSLRFTTIRLSDGAWMKANKTVGAAYTDAQTLCWNGVTPTTLACIDGDLLVGVNVGGNGRFERYRISDLKLGAIMVGYGGDPAYVALTPSALWSCNTLGTGQSGQGHLSYVGILTPPANLTNVDPGTGPRLSLGFDGPVGITGPTLGPKVGPVNVLGATSVDATHIDVDLSIRPPASGVGF